MKHQQEIVFLYLILFLFLLVNTNGEDHLSSCIVTNGQMPDSGKCRGPVERAILKREHLQELAINGACGPDKIAYFVDGDVTQPKCGQCTPGTSGFFGNERTCAVNEFCSDGGTCVNIRKHALFGAPCPYDPGFGDTVNGFCGPGLRCIRHKCLPCENGEMDLDSGMTCVNNEFTFSPVVKMLYEPTPMTLISMAAAYVLYQILLGIALLIKSIVKCRRRREKKRKEKLDETAATNDEPEDQLSSFLLATSPGSVRYQPIENAANSHLYSNMTEEHEDYNTDDDDEDSEEYEDQDELEMEDQGTSFEGKIFLHKETGRYYTVRNGKSEWITDDIENRNLKNDRTAAIAQKHRSMVSVRSSPKQLPATPQRRPYSISTSKL